MAAKTQRGGSSDQPKTTLVSSPSSTVPTASSLLATAGASPAPAPLSELPIAELVDQFGAIDEQVERFKPTLKRHKAIEDEIESRFKQHPADAQASAEGKLYVVNLGQKENRREITDTAKAYDVMKKCLGSIERLKSFFKPRLADVDACVPKPLHPQFISESRSGRRPVDVVRRAA